MGFGRSQFQDMHFSSQNARARAASSGMYSDDEYQNFDRRTKPQRSDEQWKHDTRAGKQFWEDVEREGQPKSKDDYAKRVWDEFDEFFDFDDKSTARDETKGADYKAEISVEFMDAFKGVKTVSGNCITL